MGLWVQTSLQTFIIKKIKSQVWGLNDLNCVGQWFANNVSLKQIKNIIAKSQVKDGNILDSSIVYI
jgi:hypothetical protein